MLVPKFIAAAQAAANIAGLDINATMLLAPRADDDVLWHTTWVEVAAPAVLYTIVALVFAAWWPKSRALKLLPIKLTYNVGMCLMSLWMFFGCYDTLVQNWAPHGFDLTLLLCDDQQVLRPGFKFWFFWFYVSKYIEYCDTAFIVMAGNAKPSVAWYLQVYHHATTASVAWVAWFYPAPSFMIGALTNTFVHVFMYAYYAVVLLVPGIKRWGHIMTTLQLVQFFFCCTLGPVVAYSVLAGGCQGSPYMVGWVNFIYVTYLLFFLAYYGERRQRFSGKSTSGASTSATGKHKQPKGGRSVAST